MKKINRILICIVLLSILPLTVCVMKWENTTPENHAPEIELITPSSAFHSKHWIPICFRVTDKDGDLMKVQCYWSDDYKKWNEVINEVGYNKTYCYPEYKVYSEFSEYANRHIIWRVDVTDGHNFVSEVFDI